MTNFSTLLHTLLILGICILCPATVTAQTTDPVQIFGTNANKVTIDGDYLIVGSSDIVSSWNNSVNVGNKIRNIGTGYSEPILVISSLAGYVYTITSNGPRAIRKWSYMTGGIIWRVPTSGNSHDDVITDMVVTNFGVFTSSEDGTIKQWSLSNGALVATVQAATGPAGFVIPITKLFVENSATYRLFAVFGRQKPLDGVGQATLLPSGDFEGITVDISLLSSGSLGRQRMKHDVVGSDYRTLHIHTIAQGSWRTSTVSSVFNIRCSQYSLFCPSGTYMLSFSLPAMSLSTLFVRQTITLTPGNTYRLVSHTHCALFCTLQY